MSTHLHLELRLRMSGDLPPLSLNAFKACIQETSYLFAETRNMKDKRFSVTTFQLLNVILSSISACGHFRLTKQLFTLIFTYENNCRPSRVIAKHWKLTSSR
jgi:hypothetical protein